MTDEPWRLFWAKTNRQSPDGLPTRPLWAHLIDVASAAQLLWDSHLPASLRGRLADAMGLDEEDAGRMLALWIGLHDIGKAIPSFQHQHPISEAILKEAGFAFPSSYNRHNSLHHGHASIAIMRRWLLRDKRFAPTLAGLLESMAAFVGFHHGKLWRRQEWRYTAELSNNHLGSDPSWREPQLALVDAVVEAWGVVWPRATEIPSAWPSWLLGFAGWVTLADWVGSMAEFYPDVAVNELTDYIPIGRASAASAIAHARLDMRPALRAPGFLAAFPDERISEPRPLQRCLIDLPLPDDDTPTLTIVEAPTGEGKSEGAFYLSARQQARGRGAGVYVAMPSQATSNGLYPRFLRFLTHTHNGAAGDINLLLVHGNSLLHLDAQAELDMSAQRLADQGEIFSDEEGPRGGEKRASVLAASWFLPKKRSLLAPYGVGTVDQALLSVLFSRHFFLRLYGLAGKTVIFDEVHAYDVYMGELFERLLEWLRELGADVIILSATLPGVMRERLLRAWKVGGEIAMGEAVPYPAIWSVRDGELRMSTFAADRHQEAYLAWMEHTPGAIADAVADAVARGATVAVIVNMVARAQEVFTAIRERLPEMEGDLHLFHARFPFELRGAIEGRVLERFGKGRPSGRPAVLIATQVAEQSLDLDVDLMLSDLAPIDLLLQRAGRLHRHDHHARPEACILPRLLILAPALEDRPLPELDPIGGGIIYDTLVMWKTWLALKEREKWSLPEEYRPLIEAVYGRGTDEPPTDLPADALASWAEARLKGENRRKWYVDQAEARRIQGPEGLLDMVKFQELDLADDDEEGVHRQLQAVTRLGEPSVEVVCLHEGNNGRLYLDPACREPAPLHPGLHRDQIRRLQGSALRLSSQAIVHRLFGQDEPRWAPVAEATPALMRHRALIFRNGVWSDPELPRYSILFDTVLGLIIHKQKE